MLSSAALPTGLEHFAVNSFTSISVAFGKVFLTALRSLCNNPSVTSHVPLVARKAVVIDLTDFTEGKNRG
jgi:hypothetical protein